MNLMGQASCNNLIGIGELEGHYSTYCRTMRILVREGKSMEQVQRSLCWNRLTILPTKKRTFLLFLILTIILLMMVNCLSMKLLKHRLKRGHKELNLFNI